MHNQLDDEASHNAFADSPHRNPPSFDYEDAFSDGDDERDLQFSLQAIRDKMAQQHDMNDKWTDHGGGPSIVGNNGFYEVPDLSIDLNGQSPNPPLHSRPPSPQTTPDESDNNSSLSDVHLTPNEQSLHSENSYLPENSTSQTSFQSDPPESEPPSPLTQELSIPNTVHSAPNTATFKSEEARSPVEIYVGNASAIGGASSSNSASSNYIPPIKSKAPRHKPNRSFGPSAFEKVMSKTRPTFLPPKTRNEDIRHMADWEEMMRQSRSAAEKKRKALQERRLIREKKIEESLYLWEQEIVPNWRVVHTNPRLRKLWWSGIPTQLRATMWENAVGNELSLSKDNYRTCLARAKRALSTGTFPKDTLLLIEEDVATTLPALHIFHSETGPLYQDLKDMLCAWVVSRSDEGLGYTSGISRIAAMILINMPAHQGFNVMKNLLERHCMRSFYGGENNQEDVNAYFRIFDTLLADGMPKIYFNFKQHQISPSAYLPDWLVPLFLNHLPFEACARVWDVLLLEGDSFLYRASLGILAVLEPRLFFPDRKELLELLRGDNKAAIEVAKREGRPMDGGKYEIYGVDEETLWERIDSMNDWWKDSTWTRLIHRELPDI